MAGSERIGGLRVTLYPRSDNNGAINIELSDWQTGEPHQSHQREMADIAANAIHTLAARHTFDLSQLDIKIDHFIFHDVNSPPRCYEQTARSACKAALEALQTEDDRFSTRRNW